MTLFFLPSLDRPSQLCEECIIVCIRFDTAILLAMHDRALSITNVSEHGTLHHRDFQSARDPCVLVAEELELIWHLLLDARDDLVHALAVTSGTAVVECDSVGGRSRRHCFLQRSSHNIINNIRSSFCL